MSGTYWVQGVYGMVWYGMVWYGMVWYWYGNRISYCKGSHKTIYKNTQKPKMQRFSQNHTKKTQKPKMQRFSQNHTKKQRCKGSQKNHTQKQRCKGSQIPL